MFFNITALNNKKQELLKEGFSGQLTPIGKINQEILSNPIAYFTHNIFDARRMTLNALFKMHADSVERGVGPVFSARGREVASIAGLYPSTVDREIRELTKVGLVTTDFSNPKGRILMLNPWFLQPDVKRMLSPIFKNLTLLSLFLLTPLLKAGIGRNFQSVPKLHDFRRVQGYIYKHTNVKRSFLSTRAGISAGEDPEFLKSYEATGNLENLRLTQKGRITLSAFPEHVIGYADRLLTWRPMIRDKFAYVMKVCTEWCKDLDIRPRWKSVFDAGFNLVKGNCVERESVAIMAKPKFGARGVVSPAKSSSEPTKHERTFEKLPPLMASKKEMLKAFYEDRKRYDEEARDLYNLRQQMMQRGR